MPLKQSRSRTATAVHLALAAMMMSASLNAGVINNTNPTEGGFLGLCGNDTPDTSADESRTTTCIGAWNLDNVDVKIVKSDDIEAVAGTFNPADGSYSPMAHGDSFRSYVKGATGGYSARISGKDWPVGEPTGIKAVVNDTKVTNGNPQNCIINTSFEDQNDDSNPSTTETSYLDSAHPEPVICSSAFQTHKRFKIAMLESTVAGVAPGSPGKPIDLVFNVADDGSGLRAYQVFSKINNYTGVRLKGYMIQIGRGVGAEFKTASEAGIADRLQLSRGIGDYLGDPTKNLWTDDQMATYSSGLFGLADKHFPTDGFFDNEPAGFLVGQGCTTSASLDPTTCATPDTLRSTGPLGATSSYYYTYFGDWPHQNLTPRGIFWDTDGDPTTDADLVAFWNGTQWMKPDNVGSFDPKVVDQTPSMFIPVGADELASWANDRSCYGNTKSCYTVDVIEDVLNLGLNYVLKVGDNLGTSTITVRIIPIVSENPDQAAPWTQNLPAVGDLTTETATPTTTSTTSSGGGCAAGGDGRFDPILPALLVAGLGFFGWRRYKKARK